MTLLGMYLKRIITETIEEITEAEGEGAMLIIANDGARIDKFLSSMDKDNLQMEWRKSKRLEFVDKTLLRAMLIMDGSTLIKSDSNNSKIEPRFVVYPHDKNSAFSVLDDSNKLKIDLNLDVLRGKGSKHHGAANLSMLLVLNNQVHISEFKKYLEKNQQLNLPFQIVTISADGPIKQWPNVLRKTKKRR